MTPRLLGLCIISAALAGCATTSETAAVKKPPVAKLSDQEKKDLEGRFIKDTYVALDKGDLATAASLLSRLGQIYPGSSEATLAQGEIYLRQANYGPAIDVFRKLIKENRLVARSYQGIGVANLQLGRLGEAKQAFEKAVALNDELWRTWNGLAYYYDSAKDWKQSEVSYTNALKVRRDKPSLFNNRGFSKLMQSRYEEAIADFQEALKLDANLKVTRMNIRLAQAWLGRYGEATAGVSKKELPKILNNIGYIAMLKGEYATAKMYLSRAMELSPSFNEMASINLQKLEALQSQTEATEKKTKH